MNIKDLSGISGITPVDGSRGNTGGARKNDPPEPASPASTADQLSLTAVGQYLASAAEEPAPVDRERVDAIRNALADGSYEIDSERVAARMLKLDRELP